MAVDLDTFRLDFPQFTETSDTVISRSLDRAADRLDEADWGDLYDEAQGLFAAHLLALSVQAVQTGGAASGGISSINISGEYSISYGSGSGSGSSRVVGSLELTKYGQEFLQLRDSVIPTIRIY